MNHDPLNEPVEPDEESVYVPDPTDDGGEVLPFPDRFTKHPTDTPPTDPADSPTAGPTDAPPPVDEDDDEEDEESAAKPPKPADPPNLPEPGITEVNRRPIIPEWMSNKPDFLSATGRAMGHFGYAFAFHAVRCPY